MVTDITEPAAGCQVNPAEDAELGRHLRTALEHARDPTTRFHLRQALQLLEAA